MMQQKMAKNCEEVSKYYYFFFSKYNFLLAKVNPRPLAYHPLDAHYVLVVDE
jgi:hypothetical protein